MKTALVLLLSLHLGSCCPKDDYLKNRENTPEFTCLKNDGDFETRRYDPSVWIRTLVKDKAFVAASNELKTFVQDFQKTYKNLTNVDKFDKTWPALLNHTRDDQVWISWFVPLEPKFADSWSVPLRSEVESHGSVELLHLPRSIFHIGKFSGTPSLEAGRENLNKLLSRLGWSCPDLKQLDYIGAGYDSYFSLTHHNEVWIEDSSCPRSV